LLFYFYYAKIYFDYQTILYMIFFRMEENMIIEPKVKGFICTTAHPDGCAENVKRQISYIKSKPSIDGPKNVLVIGCSTGYGLSSRITAAFGAHANTLGIMFEKEPTLKRTATAGYYNTLAFEQFAKEAGYLSETINGDAFSLDVKRQAISILKEKYGKVDMIIYSLAAPRRTDKDGITYKSVLKTVSKEFHNKNWNLGHNTIEDAVIAVATDEELFATKKVMGGEDWIDWITVLSEADVLSPNVITLAYSYIGPELTYPIYHDGSIGMAKKHLFESSKYITKEFSSKGIKAFVSVNKALVTQSSSAIPVVPLYISLLYKVMKERNVHEGCIEQMYRLLHDRVYTNGPIVESDGYIHVDDLEMQPEIQQEVMKLWNSITSENLLTLADTDGYWEDFYHMFGFHYDNVDYTKDIALI